MSRVRVSKQHAVLPPGYPRRAFWVRAVAFVGVRSRRLRALLIESPRSRLRTLLLAGYYRAIVEDLQTGVIKRHLPAITSDAETTLWGGLEVYRGGPGAEAAVEEWLRSFEGATFELRQFVNTDAKEMLCIGEMAGRGTGSGADVDLHFFFLITVEGGNAVRLRMIDDEAEALEAVGLSD